MPPLGPVGTLETIPGLASTVTTLIGAENAAGLFPVIAPGSAGSSVIAAGSAAGLFPDITPAATPSPVPGGLPQEAQPGAAPPTPAAYVAAGAPRTSVLTAQVLGLIALALAVMLTITRLSARKSPRGR